MLLLTATLHATLAAMTDHILESFPIIPPVGLKRIAMRVTKQAERALGRGHPWLFDQAILNQSHEGNPGDLAVVFDSRGKFLAIGLFDPFSPIRVRILAYKKPVQIDSQFYKRNFLKAVKIRSSLPPNTTGYRLVHGANDNFPGFVMDIYDRTLVIKLYSVAWVPHLSDVLVHLNQVVAYDQIVLRLSREVQKHPGNLFGLQDGIYIHGTKVDSPILFKENELIFEVDPISGHKTGFYLDQRDNRELVSTLCAGHSVLNTFAYTGGFSVYAAKGGARKVTGVDISRPALEAAERNFKHNRGNEKVRACIHETYSGNIFKVLPEFIKQGLKFDMVIIDPPSFAKRRSQVDKAIKAYQRLTRLGLMSLRSGGILVQASCSSQIDPETFFAAVHKAAAVENRPLHEICRTAHPLDHPITFKESSYLKCLFAVA